MQQSNLIHAALHDRGNALRPKQGFIGVFARETLGQRLAKQSQPLIEVSRADGWPLSL